MVIISLATLAYSLVNSSSIYDSVKDDELKNWLIALMIALLFAGECLVLILSIDSSSIFCPVPLITYWYAKAWIVLHSTFRGNLSAASSATDLLNAIYSCFVLGN